MYAVNHIMSVSDHSKLLLITKKNSEFYHCVEIIGFSGNLIVHMT